MEHDLARPLVAEPSDLDRQCFAAGPRGIERKRVQCGAGGLRGDPKPLACSAVIGGEKINRVGHAWSELVSGKR